MRDLVSFVQFKKREKHSWKSVNVSKVAGLRPATLLKAALPHGCFSRFSNSTNGTKSRNTSHITEALEIIAGLHEEEATYEEIHATGWVSQSKKDALTL